MLIRGTRMVVAAAIVGFGFTGAQAVAQEFTLKVHHFLSPLATTHAKMIVPWSEKIMAESGGRIKIEIYPAMQLGGRPPQLIDQVRDGVVDIVWTLPGYTPGRFTKTEVFELPFIHGEPIGTNKALAEFAERHGDEFSEYKVLALHVHGGNVIHSVKPIRVADDLKGLKIRTPTRTGGWMIEAMGATPIGAPVPKIPEMLSKGVVDAVLIPYEISLPLKVHELVDYHTILDDPVVTRVNTSTFLFAMNKAKYESLPADLQKIIDDNSGANLAEWLGRMWIEAEIRGEKKSGESGELIKMAPAEVARLRARIEQPVIDRWIAEMKKKNVDGAALVAQARALIKKHSR